MLFDVHWNPPGAK